MSTETETVSDALRLLKKGSITAEISKSKSQVISTCQRYTFAKRYKAHGVAGYSSQLLEWDATITWNKS